MQQGCYVTELAGEDAATALVGNATRLSLRHLPLRPGSQRKWPGVTPTSRRNVRVKAASPKPDWLATSTGGVRRPLRWRRRAGRRRRDARGRNGPRAHELAVGEDLDSDGPAAPGEAVQSTP